MIGDLHEQPMLHLKVKPFIVGARDWSAEVEFYCIYDFHCSLCIAACYRDHGTSNQLLESDEQSLGTL
jgi:hypothetical protein